jgi:methionyl-tRNA synthetase
MAEVSFGSDGDFSHKSMIQKVNSNLANEFGNLCQRTLTMVFKNCGEAIPTDVDPYTPEDEALLAEAATLRDKCNEFMSVQAIHKYAQTMVGMVRDANKYIDEQAPWVLRKTDPKRMATVLYVLLEVLRRVAILYQPIIPTSANKVLDLLHVPRDERTFAHLDTSPIVKGATIPKPEGVFPRIEMPEEMLVEA